MDIRIEQHGAVSVVSPRGPLAQEDADAFRTAARRAVQDSLARVVLDVQHVPFADSRGLEALVDLSDEIEEAGGSLKLCCVSETLREVFGLTGLSDLFEHFADVTSAVRSFA